MRRQRRWWLLVIALLIPVFVCAAPAENGVISTSVVGITLTLCAGGTSANPTYGRAFIAIMDQPAYVSIHSQTATPSATVGFLAAPGAFITVDHYNEFRAIRSGGTDSRYYAVCVP